MKYFLAILAVLVGAIVALISYHSWDSAKNRGYSFGYYGEFNTVSNALARINDVTILNSWHNADVSLEEFLFEIRTADGPTNRIFFSETNPIRKMSGKQLEAALIAEIDRFPSAQTNELSF
jgi:hypothetical protein